MDKLRIGLCGCGNMGGSLAAGLVGTEEAALVAVADVIPERAAAMADKYDAQPLDSLDKLLAVPGLDGVIIAVPGYLHAPLTIQAAQAGKNIFVEKPMALHVADCQAMIRAARESGVKLMVGQVLRRYEPYRSILRWLDEGRYGQVRAASIWRITDGRRWAVPGYWRAKHALSGGYLLEVGAHELDMLRCLMGAPEMVNALSRKFLDRDHEVTDYIHVQIGFSRGGAASYEGGGGTSISRYGFRIYMDGATLVSDAAFDPKAMKVYDMEGQEVSTEGEFSPDKPVQGELANWLAALRGEAEVAVPGEEGLGTVALAEAAYRSAELGRPVRYEIG
mgnify:FL=1